MTDISIAPPSSRDGSQYKSNSSIALNGLTSVAHSDGMVTLWDMNMRKCVVHYNSHKGECRGVSFSIDGRYLATAGFDSKINIIDTGDT
jgi:WD40 repeat protein